MTATKLATVADDLRTLVGHRPGWAQRSLPAGLRIVYQRLEDGTTRLALAREDAQAAGCVGAAVRVSRGHSGRHRQMVSGPGDCPFHEPSGGALAGA